MQGHCKGRKLLWGHVIGLLPTTPPHLDIVLDIPHHQCHVTMYRIRQYPTPYAQWMALHHKKGWPSMFEWMVNAMGLGLVLGEGWNDLVLGPSQGVFTQMARVLPDTHHLGPQAPWIYSFI